MKARHWILVLGMAIGFLAAAITLVWLDPADSQTAGPVVGAPCGVPYNQFDPVTGQMEHIDPWYLVELDSEGRPVRAYCPDPNAPTPGPVKPTEPPVEPPANLPIRQYFPWVKR